ncbi:hypothetical protein TcWFU_008296 [Taenia crassiceps]|uniref:CNH domain-containing protein n=1 Tax=Taenia crassiceps TaxID=6207 RepID=A0ABR4QMD0_9CEST
MTARTFAIYEQTDDTRLSRSGTLGICSACSFGNLLFLGTREGCILQLVFEEVEDQKTCYSFSVVFLRQISLAVCNENHILHVYRVVKSRLDLVNSITLPSLALAMRCLDNYAVIATNTKYLGVNLKKKTCDEIFDRSGSRVQPLIEPVSKGFSSIPTFLPLIFSANQQKQIQTLVVENVCAACMSLNRNMIFMVSQDTDSGPRIRVVRPETWDLEARRLILAGCLSDASDLIHKKYAKLVDLCNHRPATSSGAKNIFNSRSKRVYTLMGLYLFETGQLTQSREYFEKSSLDIRETCSPVAILMLLIQI